MAVAAGVKGEQKWSEGVREGGGEGERGRGEGCVGEVVSEKETGWVII